MDARDRATAAYEAALFTARGILSAGRSVPPMFTAFRAGEPVGSAVTPPFDKAEERRILLRLGLLAASLHAEMVSYISDAFVKVAPTEEALSPEFVSPEDDPAASNVLIALVLTGELTVVVTQRYRIGDRGEVSFDDPEPTWNPEQFYGNAVSILRSVVRAEHDDLPLTARTLPPEMVAVGLSLEGFLVALPE